MNATGHIQRMGTEKSDCEMTYQRRNRVNSIKDYK